MTKKIGSEGNQRKRKQKEKKMFHQADPQVQSFSGGIKNDASQSA
jgi:hypothetical protein